MTRLIDVRIRLAKARLGDFLEALPSFNAQMVGYDLLRSEGNAVANGHDKPRKSWRAKPNSNYKPAHNTAAETILKMLSSKGPMNISETLRAYKGDKHNRASLQSGFYGLRDRGMIRKNNDDKYEVVVNG